VQKQDFSWQSLVAFLSELSGQHNYVYYTVVYCILAQVIFSTTLKWLYFTLHFKYIKGIVHFLNGTCKEKLWIFTEFSYQKWQSHTILRICRKSSGYEEHLMSFRIKICGQFLLFGGEQSVQKPEISPRHEDQTHDSYLCI